MPSLMELVDRVNRGELVEPAMLEVYQDSPNSAEKFLAHHAHAMLDLRRAHQNMLQSLEAIDYSDQKVLGQFIHICSFLGIDRRADAVVRFAASAIARREYALGLEAIQNGIDCDLQHSGTYCGDRENCLFVAAQFERAAQAVGFSGVGMFGWNNQQTRIAWVVSGIGDDEPASRTVRSLASNLDAERFSLRFYSTECGVRREKQHFQHGSYVSSSAKRGRQMLEALSQQKIAHWLTPLDMDIVAAAKALADQIVRDRIDVVIFDVTPADAVSAMLANWQVARVKINLCRAMPMFAAGIDCVVCLDPLRWENDRDLWRARGMESRFLLEGIDTAQDLAPTPKRAVYGIPQQAMVLATAGDDLDRTLSQQFVEAVIHILRAHPHAMWLLIGEAELSWQKRRFESAGVSRRIGCAGRRKDMPGFLRMADLYLAEFPAAGTAAVLAAMAVERPVVAMQRDADGGDIAGIVGSEAVISGDANAYIERVSRLIREPSSRQKLGRAMRSRLEQQFSFAQTARQLEQLCDELIRRQNEGTIRQINFTDPPKLSQVA